MNHVHFIRFSFAAFLVSFPAAAWPAQLCLTSAGGQTQFRLCPGACSCAGSRSFIARRPWCSMNDLGRRLADITIGGGFARFEVAAGLASAYADEEG